LEVASVPQQQLVDPRCRLARPLQPQKLLKLSSRVRDRVIVEQIQQ